MALVTPSFENEVEFTAGDYTARIQSAEVTTSKKSNAPMIKWGLEVYGADKKVLNGQVVNTWTMLEGNIRNLKDLYRAAMKEELPKSAFDTDMLLGKEIKISLAPRMQDDGSVSRFPDVKAFSGI